jgi:pimeloyl-ACP methyl ester carboxylesterase
VDTAESSQPWTGNDMDTYADDLAKLVEALDLKDAIHVGHPQHVITGVLNTEP